MQHRRITRWLESAPSWVVAVYAVVFSFTTYFSMFAFRKPFAAASFEGANWYGGAIGLKSALVVGQVMGYGCAKFIGTKFVSETTRGRRAPLLVGMILAAEAALVFFAVAPREWRPVAMFLNGLPLGMVWGLVVWYLEGRRSSEILLAGLSCSFIVASGALKDVGRAVLNGAEIPLLGLRIANGMPAVSEEWMPATVGLLFLAPFVAAVLMLDRLPDPSPQDIAERSRRVPMGGRQRVEYLRRFWPGMSLLLITYFFVTAFRDFRDNYAVEIFTELRYDYARDATSVSRSDLYAGLGVAAVLGALYFVRDNRRGLGAVFAVMTVGVLLLGGVTWLEQQGVIGGFAWMTLLGLGSYLAYVPFGSVLFDRVMASTQTVGTAVFAIYVADSLGYVGTITALLTKDLWAADLSKLQFLQSFAYGLSLVGAVCLTLSGAYFLRAAKPTPPPA